jgi:type II secretory pathway pseudopilin PulG
MTIAECGLRNAEFPRLGARRSGLGARGSVLGSRLAARGSPRGAIYPILLISILVIGVATAGVAKLWTTEVKREKEEELLFRLGEFRRAIARYRADHNRLPKELKDLLEDRTQLQTRRYLRRLYPDPFTGKADWKLDLLTDRSGVVSGIQDVHSQAAGKSLKVFAGKKDSYGEW